jgi:hypothetical protein
MPGAPWPSWARYTATAALAFGAGIGTVVMFVTRISEKADAAAAGVADHEPRLRRLESDGATDRESIRTLKESIAELRADTKEILRRLPK